MLRPPIHFGHNEMAEDDLDIEDVEWAVRNGQLIRTEKDDPRGTKYVIEGIGIDGLQCRDFAYRSPDCYEQTTTRTHREDSGRSYDSFWSGNGSLKHP